MKIENFYNESNFITDIISAIIIFIQSFSFGIFFKRDSFLKAYIKSHLLSVYIAILIIVCETFLKSSFIIYLYAYFSFIIGLINISIRILNNQGKAKLEWQPIFYTVVPLLATFLTIMYIRIAKDIVYISWDYFSFYYPNALRPLDHFLFIPELYIPAFLYGAPLVAIETMSYVVMPNTYGAPIFYTVFLILLIIHIFRYNFSSVLFVLFNIITFIYFSSFIGYLETATLLYLLVFLILLHTTKNDIGMFIVLLVILIFLLKPYAVFGVALPLIYIVMQKIIPRKSKLLINLLMILFIFIASYLIIMQSLVNGTIITSTLDYMITALIITVLIIALFKYCSIDQSVNLRIKDTFIAIPFILIVIYTYTVDKLWGPLVLPSSEFTTRLREWIPPVSSTLSNYYTDYQLIILVMLIGNFIIYLTTFFKFKYNNIIDRPIEILVMVGMAFSFLVVLDYFPREYIRRIVLFNFIMLLFVGLRLPKHTLWPVNIYNLSIISLSIISFYFVNIAHSWLEIDLLKSINIYVYSLVNILTVLMILKHESTNGNSKFFKKIEIILFLLLIIGLLAVLYSITHIPYSRELNYYLSINKAVFSNNLEFLNNSSLLTCGFEFNKLYRLNSYDVSSLTGFTLLYSVIYHNLTLTNYGINYIVIFETPFGRSCDRFFNNKTLLFFRNVKFIKIT
jgi:hypothetical protein